MSNQFPRSRRVDYHYALPKDLIAQEPSPQRDGSRLMVVDRRGGGFSHRQFRDLPEYLGPGDLLVLNDTRVIPARLPCLRRTGGRVLMLLVEGNRENWKALLDTPRRLLPGERLSAGSLDVELLGRGQGGYWEVRFSEDPRPHLGKLGWTPLPPYIRRPQGDLPFDRERYQTVYASREGAIAAPTAGLHFTPEVLQEVQRRGVRVEFLTLHVGVGTFKPVRAEFLDEHRMEPEWFSISASVARALSEAKRVVAVGTTVTRALEHASRLGAWEGLSDLFIYPPFEFRSVGALLTNFHLPEGTPLMLACAFGGKELIWKAYHEAIREQYRFFSYGDAMLIV